MAGGRVKFGLTLPNRGVVIGATSVAEMLQLAADAESAGWDSVWVGDSIFAKPRLDAMVLLGAIAARTTRVRLGAACFASTPLRDALVLAYQWISLDFLSGGRTIFVACQGQAEPGGGAFEKEVQARDGGGFAGVRLIGYLSARPDLLYAPCTMEDDMAVELNHTIIWAKDKWASAQFLARILGVEAGPQWARFVPVRVGGVTLDFADSPERHHQHFAFLVGEEEFDAAFARIRSAGVTYYADHDRSGPGEINHYYSGRGVYFDTPDGNLFELITRPYGAVPESRGGRDAAQVG